MKSYSQKEDEKKKVNEIKTFPVPIALGEITTNITITTNSPSIPSKEQIINQAIQFHLKGNISEALKYYQYCINQGFDEHRVFSNYGAILQGLGKLQEAELSTRKAIELKPDYAEAYSNLGNILNDLGKLQEAELSIRKAIELKPDSAETHLNLGNILKNLGKLQDAVLTYRKAIELKRDFAEAHLNLGNILKDLGKSQDAVLSYRKAIEIKPNYALANYNLGNILNDLGKLQEALDSYLKAIDIDPELSNVYPKITRFLKDSEPSQFSKLKLKYILNLLLERNDIPHKELFNAFKFAYNNELIINLEIINSDISQIDLIINDAVIINALKKIIFYDDNLEKLLIKLRSNICKRIAQNIETITSSELKFIIAFGEQCFLNEYVYSLTKEENLFTNKIIQRCRYDKINEIDISILSCYFPLYKLLDQIPYLKSFNSSNQSFRSLIKLQIAEPLEEIELSQKIKKLGEINDKISQKVKSQYEVNPYPRWRYGNHSAKQKISISESINNEIKPNSISINTGDSQLEVLIAGCGTGQQILHTQILKNAQVTCIDLSLSSLSYAQRKIKELEINNVKLIQMDILELNLLEKKFDVILCSGVLHHMDDPAKGLEVLLKILKNDGFLKLGLYSEIARQNIIEARNHIARKKIHPSEDNIRNFRHEIISGDLINLNSLKNFNDFYSLSECRDLCFHTQEYRFTINQLQEILQSNELKFLGFLLSEQIKSAYKQYFPEDKKQTNLSNWVKFEEKHPNTFKAMYQFWVSKKEN